MNTTKVCNSVIRHSPVVQIKYSQGMVAEASYNECVVASSSDRIDGPPWATIQLLLLFARSKVASWCFPSSRACGANASTTIVALRGSVGIVQTLPEMVLEG